MKLRAIEITNLRRFAGQRAVLAGLGDGITVLSEPNEFGKSTFFDALHALFFERHRSTRAPVKALQPHSGGAPEVAVEIELPEGRFRLSKRWLSRPQARVTDAAGRIVAQEDEAEAWIDRLMGGDLAGPSGLLWVRQGMLGLEPEGAGAEDRRDRERGLSTRRDLLSSVAGEIEAMTGGRRMDGVLARVAAELARLATATGKPKAGGDWAQALDEAAALAAQEGGLRPRAERLTGDLARRAEVQRRLARLADPAEAAARTRALTEAQTAFDAAQAHAADLSRAETALKLACREQEAGQAEIDRLDALAARLAFAQEALAEAETRSAATRLRAEDLAARERAAAAALAAAGLAARGLRARLAVAQRARLAVAAQLRAGDLARRLDRAEAVARQAEVDRAQRGLLRITPKLLEAAQQAQAGLDRLEARAEAQAVSIEVLPQAGAQASIDGRPMAAGPQPLPGPVEIALPGFGALRIDPGASRGADLAEALAGARKAADQALAAAGVADLAAARQALGAAERLDTALRQAAAHLAEIAPEGLAALRQALASARAEAAGAGTEIEDVTVLEAEGQAAEAAETEALAAAHRAQELAGKAREIRAQAEGERLSAKRALEAAQAEAGDAEALAQQLARARGGLPALAAALGVAAAAHQALLAQAPDMATAEARLMRAKSVVEQARHEGEALRQELSALDTRIEVLAEEGIEETLSDLAGRRQAAEARAGRYETEVKALARLRQALEGARSAAREAYFRPVLRELRPLLAILHPGAEIEIDDQSLLPARLVRAGQGEDLGILSGGTREQVAILTRLAFARLFAVAGRAVPVILDDALVMSDDDRIEAMFTALHRVARDQQILVLSCRQRAFAALGGARAVVTVTAV